MINIAIAFTLLAAYVLCMIASGKKIPASLSQSVFDLPVGGRWLWTVVIGTVAFLIMPSLIARVSEDTQFLAFLACASLAFVAAAPLVKDKTDMAYKVHMISAYTCAIASQLLILINEPWLLLCWVPWVAAFVWQTKDKQKWQQAVFWAEMTCFASIFILVLI